MTAGEILDKVKAAGISLYVDAGRIVATPRAAMTDELRGLIRANKLTLVAALNATTATQSVAVEGQVARVADVAQFPDDGRLGSPALESRRRRVTALLKVHPGARYAVVVDEEDPAYPGCVVLAVGLRGDAGVIHTCDLIVPRERYDGFAIIDLIDRHSGVLH